MAVKKIGLLGGSFDPVHTAHIALADAAHRSLALDEIQLIPTANPWQRGPLGATAQERIALLELAVAGRPYLRINPIEIDRGGKTYTIDTLKALPADADYYWILGADQLNNFCSWHCWPAIVERVHLAVAKRPGVPLAVPAALTRHLEALGRPLIELPFEPMPVSASAIRGRLARGQSIKGLVDARVGQYIEQHKLYQQPAA